ncbi:winged helix-turn-helix domain-containing protein [uncultured Methylobacterium sp.]|jgi:transposase|uniref:helix-turn-helix domain-containing protein n=1 Tax=uncultured Methylobacterium sp. TaxID=157278 RepID=UPI0026376122|nr:winged helix-turn-helix domain-containing protein [uncultured Methylobacterium sp.]
MDITAPLPPAADDPDALAAAARAVLYRRAYVLTRSGFSLARVCDSLLPFTGEEPVTRAVEIRTDIATAADLRRQAKRELRRRTALRLLAVANALDGMSRAEAARAAGIERQALCDAVKRFNAEGLAGLVDRPPGRRPERLSEGEQAVLVHHVLRGPDPDQGEPASWTLPDLCRFIEARFGMTMLPQSMSRLVRRLGLSKQKTRPVQPQRDAKAAAAFVKRGSARL